MTIKYFMEGFFGEADTKGRRQIFRLKGLAERSEYNGKTFAELTAKDQRKLRNSTLRVSVLVKGVAPATFCPLG